MRIVDLLDRRSVSLDASPKDKKETILKAVELMAASGKVRDIDAYRKLVFEREEEGSTGIGEGIAIPHGRGDAVDMLGLLKKTC